MVESHGRGYDEPINALLVAVDRAPNVEHLNLEAVGVDDDAKGATVNERLQTTNPKPANPNPNPYPNPNPNQNRTTLITL